MTPAMRHGITIEAKKEAGSCPLVRCTHCGETVPRYEMAGVVYEYRKPESWRVLCKTNGCLSLPQYRELPDRKSVV